MNTVNTHPTLAPESGPNPLNMENLGIFMAVFGVVVFVVIVILYFKNKIR